MKSIASSDSPAINFPSSHLRLVRDEADAPYDGQTKAERNGAARFAMTPDAVFALHEPYAILVYTAFAHYADRDGVCWPAMGTVAQLVGISESTVMRAVKRLEDAGLIVREHTSNHGMKSANHYRLLGQECAQRQYRPTDGTYRQTDSYVPSDRRSRTVPQTVKPEPREQDPKEHTHVARLDEQSEQRLQTFRQAYPAKRRAANARELAQEWALLTVQEQECAIASVALFAKSTDWQESDGRYIPKITKFLNERRWESAPASPPSTGNKTVDLLRSMGI